jgi:hypothetical protein
MARLARLVIPGLPHHSTQRGNRRQQTFFNDGDYAAYLELMADWRREQGVEIWAYCLMPNLVLIIAVPPRFPGLPKECQSDQNSALNPGRKLIQCDWSGVYIFDKQTPAIARSLSCPFAFFQQATKAQKRAILACMGSRSMQRERLQ